MAESHIRASECCSPHKAFQKKERKKNLERNFEVTFAYILVMFLIKKNKKVYVARKPFFYKQYWLLRE
jgi:hypothetical protein